MSGQRSQAPRSRIGRRGAERCGQRCEADAVPGVLAGAASLAAIAMAAATSARFDGAAAGSPLTIADVAPFTGTDAALGPTYLVSCDAATNAINSAGGVLGHKLGCKSVDTRGDPADAVPAVRQMYASTSNLALVIGCTSDEAASVVPIFTANKTVSFCMTGQSEFDHVKFPYFYRLVPPDLSESYAMIVIAQRPAALQAGRARVRQRHRLADVHRSRRSRRSRRPARRSSANETLDLSSTTFRTEAATIVNSKPDVILTEALGPTEAAFLSEVKQLNGGKLIPVIGTSATISPDWFKSVTAAVGASTLASELLGRQPRGRDERARLPGILDGDLRREGQGRQHGRLLDVPDRAGSSPPLRRHQPGGARDDRVARAPRGPSTRRTSRRSATGRRARRSSTRSRRAPRRSRPGKQIRYEGPGGPTSFDAYHDSTGIFQVDRYTANGSVNVTANISTASCARSASDRRDGRPPAGHVGGTRRYRPLHGPGGPAARQRRAPPPGSVTCST